MATSILFSNQSVDIGVPDQSAASGGSGFVPQDFSRILPKRGESSSFPWGNNALYGEQMLQGLSLIQPWQGRPTGIFVPSQPGGEGMPLDVYFRGAKAAIQNAPKRRANQARYFHEEMRWLAENSNGFPGKWLALRGQQLLAVGATAKEVFSQVADLEPPPLVVRISEEDLPFAGW